MAMWVAHAQPLATPAATVAAGHVGRCPGLVDEHQPLGIEVELAVEPCLPLAQDVGTVLLDRVPDLFLRVIPCLAKKRCSVEIATVTPAWPSSRRNSSSVMSRRAPCSARIVSRCASIRHDRVSPPCALAA